MLHLFMQKGIKPFSRTVRPVSCNKVKSHKSNQRKVLLGEILIAIDTCQKKDKKYVG